MVAQGLRLPRALGNPGHSVAQGNRSPRALGRPGHTVAQETESPMALGRPGPRLPFPEHKNKYFATLGVCTIITYKCLTLFNIYFHNLKERMWYVVVIQIIMSFLQHNLIFSIEYFKRGFYFSKYKNITPRTEIIFIYGPMSINSADLLIGKMGILGNWELT